MIYSPMVQKAAELACLAHAHQVDKGGYPYILHPLHLAEQTDTEEECIVALLHDIVEDTWVSFNFLKGMGFSEKILDALFALTKEKDEPYSHYIARVKKNPLALKIKILDLQHNLDVARMRGCNLPNGQIQSLQKRYLNALQYLLSNA